MDLIQGALAPILKSRDIIFAATTLGICGQCTSVFGNTEVTMERSCWDRHEDFRCESRQCISAHNSRITSSLALGI